jgi:hypothetical protein
MAEEFKDRLAELILQTVEAFCPRNAPRQDRLLWFVSVMICQSSLDSDAKTQALMRAGVIPPTRRRGARRAAAK